MTLFFHKAHTVSGATIPRRKFTGWAVLYFFVLVCVPVLLIALALDVLFYFIFQEFFDSCYAVTCLFK